MKFKKGGFTLIEILIAIGLTSLILVGMFGVVTAYTKIWKITSSEAANKKFNQEIVVRRTLSNEMSTVIAGLNSILSNKTLTFRKFDGTEAIENDKEDTVFLYWQSMNQLPFINDDKGGITECWLKYMGQRKSTDKLKGPPAALRLYYRSWAPGKQPKLDGSDGNLEEYVELLQNCVGINFGYTENLSSSPDIGFYATPKFRGSAAGTKPDLPEVVQILIASPTPTTTPPPTPT